MNFKEDLVERVAVYIDGSNFYFSIKNTFKCKIDIEKFCKKIVGKNELSFIKYYISPVEQFSQPKMYAQQQSFLEKIKRINKLQIIFGRLEKRKSEGTVYYVEKASDVNLALDMTIDAQKGKYDTAYIVSNDGDFSGAVSVAIGFSKKVIYVAIGNNKNISHHLKKVASSTLRVQKEFIEECKLSD